MLELKQSEEVEVIRDTGGTSAQAFAALTSGRGHYTRRTAATRRHDGFAVERIPLSTKQAASDRDRRRHKHTVHKLEDEDPVGIRIYRLDGSRTTSLRSCLGQDKERRRGSHLELC